MTLVHENLVVWQRADDLFVEVHCLTHQHFPRHERYELGSQLRRSAYSVPANVVEGIARQHTRDAIRFFDIASASLSETGYGLHAARRLGYIDATRYERFEQSLRRIAAPLHGLIARYRTRGGIIHEAN
ncbi:MAG: four helix bundle protein [Vicinamibacterales bacterium]